MVYVVTLLFVVGLAILLPCAYLLFLTIAGFFARSSATATVVPRTRFAILIPAHNEEKLLPRLLESINDVDYPRELMDVYVVADNCDDSTAQIAANYGTDVFERYDDELVGKPYALRWLLERVHEKNRAHDAYLFVDADSLLSVNFMRVMDAKLQSGSKVVQSYYTVSNATQSPVSSLRFVALILMHYARPLGRKVLGLSSGLFGTGMVFRKDVLDEHGWDSYTLAEDVEYFMKLTGRGIRVDFAPEAVLSAQMPETLKDAKSQNLRWERGRLAMARTYGIRYFVQGLLRFNFVKADAGLQQLIPPMSIMSIAVMLYVALSLVTGNIAIIAVGVAALASLAGHVILGLVVARAPLKVYRAFLFAPAFILWKLFVYAEAMIPKRTSWTRTERS